MKTAFSAPTLSHFFLAGLYSFCVSISGGFAGQNGVHLWDPCLLAFHGTSVSLQHFPCFSSLFHATSDDLTLLPTSFLFGWQPGEFSLITPFLTQLLPAHSLTVQSAAGQ